MSGHKKISIFKSCIRIVACGVFYYASHGLMAVGSVLLLVAEIVGIVEEWGEK